MTQSKASPTAPRKAPSLRSPRLRTLLIVFFSLLLAGAVITTGLIGYRGGYTAADVLVGTIQSKTMANIEGELDAYLAAPMRVN
ncbi:MAG: hypothetical protein IH608_07700, partial [Proteobacteria bacterium]|nr:hypothetical protein [Pseudomonadota bacterium]